MTYFPMFLNFDNKKVLIVGGGKIAEQKLKVILNFTNNITLVSKRFDKNVSVLLKLKLLNHSLKEYQQGDIDGFDIVIVAVDDFALQESIYFEAKSKNILCNCVDLQQYCDFIFPSIIKKGDLTVAISTSGSSPAFAKEFRKYLEKLIPKNIDTFLVKMRGYRKTMPKGVERMQFLEKKAKNFIKKFKS